MKNLCKFVVSCCALLVGMAPLVANATEFSYSLFSDLTYSDNINSSSTGDEGSSLTVGGTVNLDSDGYAGWYFDINGSYSAIDYSESGLSNEQRKTFSTSVEYRPTTNNLSLLVLQNLSQVPQNRFTTTDVNNVRDVNILTVEPGYFIHLSPSDQINLQATFTRLDNGESTSDDTFVDGSRDTREYTLGYERQINALNFVSLIGEKQETLFDEDMNAGGLDFSQADLFLRWSYQGGTTQVTVDFGVSEVTNDNDDEDIDSDLYSVSFSRQLNSSHSLVFTSSKGFNNLLRTDINTEIVSTDDDLSDFSQAVAVRDSNLSYTAKGTSFDVVANSTYRKIDGTAVRSSETRRGFGLGVTYYVSRAFNSPLDTNISVAYNRSKNTFENSLTNVNQNKVEFISVTYNHSYSRSLNFYARLSTRDTSQDGNTSGDSNALTLGFTYRPLIRQF